MTTKTVHATLFLQGSVTFKEDGRLDDQTALRGDEEGVSHEMRGVHSNTC